MSEFNVNGYILNDKYLYTGGACGQVIRVRKLTYHGFESFEFAFINDGNKGWHKVGRDNLDSVLKNLIPVGVLSDELKIKRNLSSRYEIGKLYAFADYEDATIEECMITPLSGVDEGARYQFNTCDGAFKYAREIEADFIGKIDD